MDQFQEIILELQKLNLQMGRLISDFESEKEVRKRLIQDHETRIRELENRYNEFHGRMIATVGIIAIIFSAVVALIVKLL